MHFLEAKYDGKKLRSIEQNHIASQLCNWWMYFFCCERPLVENVLWYFVSHLYATKFVIYYINVDLSLIAHYIRWMNNIFMEMEETEELTYFKALWDTFSVI